MHLGILFYTFAILYPNDIFYMNEGINLKNPPDLIKDFILDVQNKMRKSKSGKPKHRSQEAAVYKIIETHPEFIAINKK